MKNKKSLQNIKVLIFDGDRNIVSAEKGINIVADQIECESGVYHLGDAKIYTDEWNGQIYYCFNVDLPARVEASHLKTLRRSTALSNILSYRVAKPLDLFKLMPWIAIILLILMGGK